MKEEIWKPIKDYEGLYEVSNYGRVKSLDRFNYKGHHNLEKILKYGKASNGYYTVNLIKNKIQKNKLVHRLVAQAFIPNPDNLPVINHRDGNKLNNYVDNLEFCSYSHNNKEAYRLGLKKQNKLSQKIIQYDKSLKKIKVWNSMKEILCKNKYRSCHIYECCKGKRKSAYGYIWKYEEEFI